MDNGLECNIKAVWEDFKVLTAKEMDMAVKSALRRGAAQIKKETVSNAKAGIKTHNNPHWYNGQRIEYNDDITDAVRVGKIEDNYDSDELSIKVHVMGTRNTNSGTYRFRFLEKGTKNRKAKTYKGRPLKKERNLGSIAPRRWFASANNSVNLDNIYLEAIERAINNINNGKR
jgi:hypothetical protein